MKYKQSKTAEEYLNQRYEESSDGCWNWTGPKNKQGYGVSRFSPTKPWADKAHRKAWLTWVDSIPEGCCICHKCDNPSCINPDHLFVGTLKDNNLDRVSKKRSAIGERSGRAKITDKEVSYIRSNYPDTGSKELAEMFDISRRQVQSILNGSSRAYSVNEETGNE